jgi:allophanate hydrolase
MSIEWDAITGSLDFGTLHRLYRSDVLRPVEVIDAVYRRIEASGDDRVWISLIPRHIALARAEELFAQRVGHDTLAPLWGLPFAVKDNIDLAGVPTTAACPAYAYVPKRSATVIDRLIAAGAMVIGKTNLDQFATGLVGVRSPYGAPCNPFDSAYIPGGSSSGSAVAVARSLVSFALGTDTAGSGRIPAGYCNVVGLKPSRGLISTAGVVPACRSLDCVSILTLTVNDAARVLSVAAAPDAGDVFSRVAPPQRTLSPSPQDFRFGVPDQLEFYGDREAGQLYRQALERLEMLGGHTVPIAFTPFAEAGRLLYEGPWVAERLAAIESFFVASSEALHPVTRQIIAGAGRFSAVETFRAFYRLQDLRAQTRPVWEGIDCLVVPTAPTIYRLTEVEAEPVRLNSQLGLYTNFVNLLDLAAVAVPCGFGAQGLASGITLIAPAFHEDRLLELAAAFQFQSGLSLGATAHTLKHQ